MKTCEECRDKFLHTVIEAQYLLDKVQKLLTESEKYIREEWKEKHRKPSA